MAAAGTKAGAKKAKATRAAKRQPLEPAVVVGAQRPTAAPGVGTERIASPPNLAALEMLRSRRDKAAAKERAAKLPDHGRHVAPQGLNRLPKGFPVGAVPGGGSQQGLGVRRLEPVLEGRNFWSWVEPGKATSNGGGPALRSGQEAEGGVSKDGGHKWRLAGPQAVSPGASPALSGEVILNVLTSWSWQSGPAWTCPSSRRWRKGREPTQSHWFGPSGYRQKALPSPSRGSIDLTRDRLRHRSCPQWQGGPRVPEIGSQSRRHRLASEGRGRGVLAALAV
jgi:hypothetical protein